MSIRKNSFLPLLHQATLQTMHYKATLRRDGVTIVAVESSKYSYYILWACVCSLRYPDLNSYAPFCHLWSARLCKVFPHYLINGNNFEKKLLNIKCVLWFFIQHFHEKNLILRRTERDIIKSVYRSLFLKYPLFFSDLNEN